MKTESVRILAVDDDHLALQFLSEVLCRKGYEVSCAEDGRQALSLIEGNAFAVVLTDLRMPGIDGLELLKAAKQIRPETEVIIETAYGSVEGAVEAVKIGAFDYVTKPFSEERIETLVERAVERYHLKEETRRLKEELGKQRQGPRIIGRHPRLRSALERARLAAGTDATVLVRGESGTGKELFARQLHDESPRRDRPFVKVSCAALPESLLEAELFGHERGAFTNAYQKRIGRFERAHGGTIFLDEIGDLSASTQIHLLDVLQDRRFVRLGSNDPIAIDIRVIAATNRNLEELLEQGRFREDLYYRLKVVQIHVPPLRERKEDIPLLAEHFLQQAAARCDRSPACLSPEAWEVLGAYDWPGNVRELENAIESAIIVSTGHLVRPRDLPESIQASSAGSESRQTIMSLAAGERDLICRALRKTGWNRSAAAQLLGVDRSTLARKIQAYGVTRAAPLRARCRKVPHFS